MLQLSIFPSILKRKLQLLSYGTISLIPKPKTLSTIKQKLTSCIKMNFDEEKFLYILS